MYTTAMSLDDVFGVYTFAKKKKPGLIVSHDVSIKTDKLELMSPAARYNLTIPNCGGLSIFSESMSMDLMHLFFSAKNFISETYVQYKYQCKKVDYLTIINGEQIGVSVSRSALYKELTNEDGQYTPYIAYRQLLKKLGGLVVARAGITEAHHYDRSILHIFCESEKIAGYLRDSFPRAAKELQVEDEISLLLTVCKHPGIYDDDLSIFGDIVRPTLSKIHFVEGSIAYRSESDS